MLCSLGSASSPQPFGFEATGGPAVVLLLWLSELESSVSLDLQVVLQALANLDQCSKIDQIHPGLCIDSLKICFFTGKFTRSLFPKSPEWIPRIRIALKPGAQALHPDP